MATLNILKGPGAGARFPLGAEPVTIGRGPECDVVLDDPRAAVRHATVRLRDGRWQVLDLSEGPGTHVNGCVTVDWTDLGPGDHVRVGRTFFSIDASGAGPEHARQEEAVFATAGASAPVAGPARVQASPRGPAVTATAAPPLVAAHAHPARSAARPAAELAAPERADAPAARDAELPAPEIPGCIGLTLLSRGPVCSVWKGRQIAHARDVLIRVVDAGGEHANRIRGAAERAAGLSHANLASVLEVGETNGLPFVMTESLPGGTLADQVAAAGRGGLPWRDAVRTLKLAAAGLAHLHEQGFVHGAVRPSNVLVGKQGQAKFGAPCSAGEGDTAAPPAFISPEQARGEAPTVASDVYSLGATLYFAVSGCTPHPAGDPSEVIGRIAFSAPEPLETVRPGLPLELYLAVRSMMSGDRAARPANVLAAVRRLPATLDADTAAAPVARRRKSSLRTGFLGFLGFAALSAVVWFALRESREGRDGTGQSGPVATESEASRRFRALLEREKQLGAMTADNLAGFRAISDECARLGAEFSIEDPVVPKIWRHRRGLVRSVTALEEAGPESMQHVNAWIAEISASAAGASLPGTGGSRDLASLEASRARTVLAAEQMIDEGRITEGLGHVAGWLAAERAAAKRRSAAPEEWTEIQAAAEWLRTTGGSIAVRLRADLAVDAEILSAHFAETSCIGDARAPVPGPEFGRACERLGKIEALLVTWPLRARLAARRASLDLQAAALAAVDAVAPPPPADAAPERWRAALLKSIETAFGTIAPEHRAGALSLLVEVGDAARVRRFAEQADTLPESAQDGARAETEAFLRFEEARAVREPAQRRDAIAAWSAKHGATDTGLVLATRAERDPIGDVPPLVSPADAKRFLDAWGGVPAAEAPPKPAK